MSTYRTAAGSIVSVAHNVEMISFDWFEENSCIEALPTVDLADLVLRWHCDCCGDGLAALTEVPA